MKRKLGILLLLMVMTFSFSTSFALDDSVRNYLETSGSTDGSGKLSISKFSSGTHFSYDPSSGGERVDLVYEGGNVTIFITDEQEALMVAELDKVVKAQAEIDEVNQEVDDLLGGLNVGADVGQANTLLSGFMGIVRLALGIMCVLITIGMTIFSALDICYIAFPVFQQNCENQRATGQGPMVRGGGKGGSGSNSLWVSRDAQRAVEQANTDQSGKNPFLIYFKSRILSYILLAILLFILLTGNITLITDLALKAVSGIMEVLGTI